MTTPLLEINGLGKYFGGLAANQNINFKVLPGEIVGIIGPNGAGKTTLFNCITGFETPDSGRVIFDQRPIAGLPAHSVARLGMTRTFQVYAATGDLNLVETVMVGAFMKTGSPKVARKKSFELLETFKIHGQANTRLSQMPMAKQKLALMIAAIATRPKLLLLDEVVAGLNPSEIDEFIDQIRLVHDLMGVTVLLIEHILDFILKLCHRVIVLDHGQIIAQGRAREIAEDPRVIEAYLGERYARVMTGKGSQNDPAA